FWRAFANGARKFALAVEHRQAIRALGRLDDRMLADIGLTRSDLAGSSPGSLWNSRSDSLRARALERRLARYGISHGFEPVNVIPAPLVPKVDQSAVSQARDSFCKCS